MLSEQENYYRLFDLISVTGKLILDTYMSTLLQGMSVEDFVNNKKHKIFHLWKYRTPCCNCNGRFRPLKHQLLFPKQWDSMFMKNNNQCHTSLDCICGYIAKGGLGFAAFDITLITCILMNCVTMPTTAIANVKAMRELRNRIHHKGAKTLTNEEFDQYRQEVKKCILNLAGECSPTIKHEFEIKIEARLLAVLNPTTVLETLRIIQESQPDKQVDLTPRAIQESQPDQPYYQAMDTLLEEVKGLTDILHMLKRKLIISDPTRTHLATPDERNTSPKHDMCQKKSYSCGVSSQVCVQCQTVHVLPREDQLDTKAIWTASVDQVNYNRPPFREDVTQSEQNREEHRTQEEVLPGNLTINGNRSSTNSISQPVEFVSFIGNVRKRLSDELPYLISNLNPDVILENDSFHTLIGSCEREGILRNPTRGTRAKELLQIIADTSDINIQEFLNILLCTGQKDIYNALTRGKPTSRERIRFVSGVPHVNSLENDEMNLQLVLQFQGNDGVRREETLQNYFQREPIEIDELIRQFANLSLYDTSQGSVVIHLRTTDSSGNALESIQRSFINGNLKRMILAILQKSRIDEEAVVHVTVNIENRFETKSKDKTFYKGHFEYLLEELCPKPVAALLYEEDIINSHEVCLVFCDDQWDRRSQVKQLIAIMETKHGAVDHFLQALRDSFQSRVAATMSNKCDTDPVRSQAKGTNFPIPTNTNTDETMLSDEDTSLSEDQTISYSATADTGQTPLLSTEDFSSLSHGSDLLPNVDSSGQTQSSRRKVKQYPVRSQAKGTNFPIPTNINTDETMLSDEDTSLSEDQTISYSATAYTGQTPLLSTEDFSSLSHGSDLLPNVDSSGQTQSSRRKVKQYPVRSQAKGTNFPIPTNINTDETMLSDEDTSLSEDQTISYSATAYTGQTPLLSTEDFSSLSHGSDLLPNVDSSGQTQSSRRKVKQSNQLHGKRLEMN